MNTNLTTLLLSALATGLAGSAHCIGMCGGIGATLGLNAKRKRYVPSYHLGRLLSYAMLGLFLGAILPLLGINPSQPDWGIYLRLLTAILIIAIGIQIFFDINLMRKLEQYGLFLWQPISKLVQHFLPARTHIDALILGLLWGLLPCGLIYAALGLAISSANPFTALFIMIVFGIGTLPSMLSVTLFSGTVVKTLTQNSSKKILGILVIAMGAWSLFELI